MKPGIQAVLFDLDGTLIDSAADLAGAANDLRQRHGMGPLPFDLLRPLVGSGARGMVGAAFGVAPGEPSFNGLREAFLEIYETRSLRETQVFADMAPVLDRLTELGHRWGIVTNKMTRYTLPVVAGLGLNRACAALVCGDTTPHAKPHPAPLWEAARLIGVQAPACVYVGDDLRDVQAARAAGMPALVAGWGYLGGGADVASWDAHAILSEPIELLQWLELA